LINRNDSGGDRECPVNMAFTKEQCSGGSSCGLDAAVEQRVSLRAHRAYAASHFAFAA
jgi:hypothetical protein